MEPTFDNNIDSFKTKICRLINGSILDFQERNHVKIESIEIEMIDISTNTVSMKKIKQINITYNESNTES